MRERGTTSMTLILRENEVVATNDDDDDEDEDEKG
jgi:hypothetical protein